MKVLILSRYDRMGASSRLRLFQFIPLWEASGIQCILHPLLNEQYLNELYSKRGISIQNLWRCYLSMAGRLMKVGQFDLVVIEKEVFPFLPSLAERWLSFRKIPYIVDYDDAIFHNYDLHPRKAVRWLLGRKIASVMGRSDAVVCGNEYLAEYARRAGARRVTVIPTVVDPERYGHMTGEHGRPLVIGWIGSPSSTRYVRRLKGVLETVMTKHNARLHLIGSGEGIGLGIRESIFPWSEATESALIGAFDIGIMPLDDSPWERGKCGYKLIQYMAAGIPVVGSPVGVNAAIIEDGINGFKPVGDAAWIEALDLLLDNAVMRQAMGARGRAHVRERYALHIAAGLWLNEFSHVMKQP